jgi:hypothetical protein
MPMMKKIWNILFIMIGISVSLTASSRSDVKIIEATEKIRFLGQKISKEYLYFYYNPKKSELKENLFKDVEMLELSIQDIAMSTKSKDSKNILDFLSYSKSEIKELLLKPVSKKRAILMLDYSESFLEGANSIASFHKYEFTDEEKMLMSMKEFEYLLERVSKYYIASNLNLDRANNFEYLIDAILKIEVIIKRINAYAYPKELKDKVEKMNQTWNIYKEFLYLSQQIFLPNLLESSTKNLKETLDVMALYHKKNQ